MRTNNHQRKAGLVVSANYDSYLEEDVYDGLQSFFARLDFLDLDSTF
jgi:hypothetical protein